MVAPLAIVTGAAGFIGRHCGAELAACGFSVAGLDRFPLPNHSEWGFAQWRNGSVSQEALNGLLDGNGTPAVIIHCAGSGSVADSYADPKADFQANVVTTSEVLEFARTCGCGAFVLPSSAAVYGQTKGTPIKEIAPLRPMSPYGVHKHMSELLCRSYGTQYGVPVVCVRLFSIYGQGLKKQLLWDACQKAAAGKFQFSGSGSELRDWLHVSDAARLLCLAARHVSPSCPIANGGSGKGVAVKSILTRLGEFWQPGLVPVFSGVARRGDPTDYIADISVIATWGFEPQADLTDELAQYVKWFRESVGGSRSS